MGLDSTPVREFDTRAVYGGNNEMKCYTCANKKRIPGDCHIGCSNPPTAYETIGCGGNERYQIAETRANDNQSVVRCVWPGSGLFPICFDGNTVFGCFHYKEAIKP